MKQKIKAIINDLGNYASNEKPQRNEHNVIIPFSLHYTDANLLFGYICELEDYKQRIDKALEYIGNSDLEIPRKTRKKFIKILEGSEE